MDAAAPLAAGGWPGFSLLWLLLPIALVVAATTVLVVRTRLRRQVELPFDRFTPPH
jgi:hypothetical protein